MVKPLGRIGDHDTHLLHSEDIRCEGTPNPLAGAPIW